MEIERRTNTVELRVAVKADKPVIEGYGAKFRTLSEPMPIIRDGEKIGTFREQLMPGCFASAIPVSDIRSLFNHDPNLILGRTASGTMVVSEDETGLCFEVDPPDTTYARNLQVSMSRGDITQCSFGFNVAEGGDTYTKDTANPGAWIRSIHRVAKLYDVSPVTYPAYVDTQCAVRSLLNEIKTEETEHEKRVAAELAEEQRKADEATAALEEEQRVAAELAEKEEVERVVEEQRKAQIETDNAKARLRLLELEMN